MRNAGENLQTIYLLRPIPDFQYTPSLIHPFGAPSPRGKARACGAIDYNLLLSATSRTRSAKALQAASQADWVPLRMPPPKFVSLGGL